MKDNAKISIALWFDQQAKEAMHFYASIFPKSQVHHSDAIVTDATLSGVQFTGINGGAAFRPNPAISFMATLETKEELDTIWERLLPEGKVLMALDKYPWSDHYGWLEDKYGVSWQLYLGDLNGVNGQQIVPTLLFTQEQNGKCEEAIEFYESVFPTFHKFGILRHQDGELSGKVQHTQFSANNFLLMAMDGGLTHNFSFNEGVSLVVHCDNQEDIDYYWNAFTQQGKESMCGWCKDPYGVSWQVIPKGIEKMLQNPSATTALMEMKKIIINELN